MTGDDTCELWCFSRFFSKLFKAVLCWLQTTVESAFGFQKSRESAPVARIVLKDCLTKKGDQSACRRCTAKRRRGRQRSCALLRRETEEAKNGEVWSVQETGLCEMVRERSWWALPEYGGPLRATDLASSGGGGEAA